MTDLFPKALIAIILLVKLVEPSCLDISPLTLKTGQSSDPQINSFGTVYGNHSADEARLDTGAGWCVTNDSAPHLIINFKELVSITKISTQGATDKKDVYYTPKFKLQFGYEDGQWYDLVKDSKPVEFIGNSDLETRVNNTIRETMARFVKILPIFPEDTRIICLRMELYGCNSVLKPKVILSQETLNLKDEETGEVRCKASGQKRMFSEWLKATDDLMAMAHDVSNLTNGIYYEESSKLSFKRPSRMTYYDKSCSLDKEEAVVVCKKNYTCHASYSFNKSINAEKRINVNFKKSVTVDVTVNNGILSPVLADTKTAKNITCSAHTQDAADIIWTHKIVASWTKNSVEQLQKSHLDFSKHSALLLQFTSGDVINALTCLKEEGRIEIRCNTKFYCKAFYNFNESIAAEKSVDVFFFIALPGNPSSPQAACSTDMCTISWSQPEFGDILPSNMFYKVIIKGNSKIIHENVIQRMSFKASSLAPYGSYTAEIKTQVQSSSGKLIWESTALVHNFQTRPAEPTLMPKVKISNSTSNSIYVEWEKVILPKRNGELLKYDLELELTSYGGYSPNEVSGLNPSFHMVNVEKTILHYTFSKLKPWSDYTFRIRTINNHFQLGPSRTTRLKTKESVPSAPPSNVQVYRVQSNYVDLHWEEPALLSRNGYITQYEIKWKHIPTQRARRELAGFQMLVSQSQCRADSGCRQRISGLEPYQTYAFQIAARNSAGIGRFSYLKSIRTAQAGPSAPHSLGYNENKTEFFLMWQAPLKPNGILKEYEIRMIIQGNVKTHFTENTDLFYDTKINSTSTITFKVRGYTDDLHNIGGFPGNWSTWAIAKRLIHHRHRPVYKPPILAIVLSFTIILILLIVLIIVLFILNRRRERGSSRQKLEVEMDSVAEAEDDEDINIVNGENIPLTQYFGSHETVDVPTEDHAHLPVPVEEFHSYVNRMHESDDEPFHAQYRNELMSGKCYSTEIALRPDNKPKNRYVNITAYDHSRVILKPEGGKRLSHHRESDYFNANYIEGYCPESPSRYIACQGPMESVFADFWRMVWQENSSVIVMLTNLEELGKIKCHQYWPSHGACKYGNVTVRFKSSDQTADYFVRWFEIEKGTGKEKEKRAVVQFHFISWPDNGVPEFPTAILSLRRGVRHYYNGESPIIIHCSAGVGRTGCFILIDAMLERIDSGEGNVDIFNYLQYMRTRRINMVQTAVQYIFAHTAVLEYITFGNSEIPVTEFEKKVRELKANDEISEQFNLIEKTSPDLESIDNSYKVLLKNGKFLDIFYIDGYKQRDAFFLCNSPSEGMAPDFWSMLVEHECHTIVMLNRLEEEDNHKYWPELNTHSRYDSISVVMTSEQQNGNIMTRKFKITSIEAPEEEFKVQHFQFLGWPSDGVPKNRNSILTLMSLVEKSRQNYGNGPVLIHSGNGASRSGTFIAIYNSTERLKVEQLIDVLQCVRAIRTVVPIAVGTAEQYEFIYEMIRTYLEAFETYSNFSDGTLSVEL